MRAVTLSGKMTVPEVHSDDGVIAWEDGEGLRLVLIHGMFGDYLDWEPVLATLAERYHVVAVDLPGFGNAGKPDADYSAGFFLERLHGALGSAPLVLAGNSFGGQIAMLYTLAYPEQVERLILVDTGGLVNFSDVQKQWLLSRFPEPVLRALTPEIHQTMFRPLFVNGSPRLDRYIAKHDAKLSRVDYPEYTRALMRSMRLSVNTCLLDRLGEIRCPVLLLNGERDPVVPVELVRQALPQFPNARLEVIPGCGHVPQIDCPDAFVAIVERFLSQP